MGDTRFRQSGGRRTAKGPYRTEEDQRRREEAAERVAEWRKLTPAEQVAELDRRLGKGVGAVKQRARLSGGVK